MSKHLKRELRSIAPAELRRVHGGGDGSPVVAQMQLGRGGHGHEEHIELVSISFGPTTPTR